MKKKCLFFGQKSLFLGLKWPILSEILPVLVKIMSILGQFRPILAQNGLILAFFGHIWPIFPNWLFARKHEKKIIFCLGHVAHWKNSWSFFLSSKTRNWPILVGQFLVESRAICPWKNRNQPPKLGLLRPYLTTRWLAQNHSMKHSVAWWKTATSRVFLIARFGISPKSSS